jgi:radical SAM protein with 4Fe4S-binding SPASM domain
LILAREFERIDRLLDSGQTFLPGRGKLCACNGVFKSLAVLHDGTIVPCNILHSLPLGVIGSDSLQEIWLNHSTMIALRQRININLHSLVTCRDCKYQGFCAGGCPAGALFHNGNINSRNPFSCYRVLRNEDPFFSLN